MINAVRRLTGATLVLGLLAGCSYSSRNDDAPTATAQVLAVGTQVITSRKSGKPEKIVLSSEDLASITEPVIQINPERFGGSDFLARAASRRDSGLGTVEVWNSSDNAQIFLRNGVLVGTRGIGGDIIAADANVTIRALDSRANAGGLRNYTVSDGDNTTTEYSFRCDIGNVGAEKIRVADQVFNTQHMRESCVSDTHENLRLNNEYWVQSGSDLVRKSHQWVGPSTGYFEILVIRN